ncbi:S1C family serine protease [Lignipirellula cremea]|uniref:Serine protease HtrA n=1 Tax=Lignipirellula cremea TaxID=2528010 RepID=A0A518E1Z3_9BACT|nr:trypsin-like peptidase domain-containing protein [Lignipirellula cremea]QDU98109.1 Putative serine protease HtrA [Lignipirellula cremea]
MKRCMESPVRSLGASVRAWVTLFGWSVVFCQTGIFCQRDAFCQEPGIRPDELALVKKAEAARVAAIEKVYGAVVAVYGADQSEGGGSGVIYDPAGFALTNYHVVAGAGNQGVAGLADGKLYPWKLIGVDPGGDVALIRLSGRDAFPYAPLGDSRTVRVGDWALAMGNPFLLAEDQKPTVTLGVVSGVQRYQPGVGVNELVYGDCLQVDSSINPGNSGGPLFNLQSQVVGVNGRASFQDRGRVNVGLGYAISINQVKRFLPDLLATRTAQHGTLDAVFGQRDGKVICHTLNLDSPAALAGLQLGDEMLEFEGQAITQANQLTNLLSTLPAHWPVEFQVARGETRQTIAVRLLPLPYGDAFAPPVEGPEDGQEEEKEDGKPDRETPRLLRGEDGFRPAEPGEIGDVEINRGVCELLLARTRQSLLAPPGEAFAVELHDTLLKDDRPVGEQTLTLARDGRLLVEVREGEARTRYGFDGQTYWSQRGVAPAVRLSPAEALAQPLLAQAAVLSRLLQPPAREKGKGSLLEGGDKVNGAAAFRLDWTEAAGRPAFLWLSSLPDAAEADPVRTLPVKFCVDREGVAPAVMLEDWRKAPGMLLPWRRRIVRGLSETPLFVLQTQECLVLKEVNDATFAAPQE